MFSIETVDGVTIIGFNRAATAMEQDERGNIMFTNIEQEVAQAPAAPTAPLPVVPQYVPAEPATPAPTPAQTVAPTIDEPASSSSEEENDETESSEQGDW